MFSKSPNSCEEIQNFINANIDLCSRFNYRNENDERLKSKCKTVMKKLFEIRDSPRKCPSCSDKKELFDTLKFSVTLFKYYGSIRCYSKNPFETYNKKEQLPTHLFVYSKDRKIDPICKMVSSVSNDCYTTTLDLHEVSEDDPSVNYLKGIIVSVK